jgi:hypothetical protein
MLFFVKAMLNWKSFIDEISSPTTSSPAGLIFMTMALAFIGKGDIGEMLVIVASLLHLVLVVWFIYMSLAYQTMPGEVMLHDINEMFSSYYSLPYLL